MANYGKILVVDDDVMMQKSLKEALEVFKFSVEAVGNARDALELVNKFKFNCALIDQVLEIDEGDILDGIDLTNEIHKINPDIAAIVFSGKENESAQSRKRALEAGVYRYIYKPFTVPQIKVILESLIPSLQDLQEITAQLGTPHRERKILQNMLEQMGVGVSIVDRNYRIWYVNNILEEMTEGNVKKGNICWYAYRQDLNQTTSCHYCPIQKMFSTSEIQKRIVLYNINNKLKYFEKVASPILSKKGEVIAALECTSDVTESEILHKMERQFEDAIELDKRLEIILQYINELGYDRARIYLLSHDKKEMIGKKEVGGGLKVPFDTYRLPIEGDKYWEKLIKTKKPQIFNGEYGKHRWFEELALDDVVNWLEMPLIIEGNRIIGAVAIDYKFTRRTFSDEDIKKLQPYIALAASSLEISQKYQAVIDDSEKLRLVREFDINIARLHDLEKVLKYVTRSIVKMTGAYAGHLRTCDNNKLILVSSSGNLAKALPDVLTIEKDNQLLAIQTMLTKLSNVISNVKTNSHFYNWVNELDDINLKQHWSKVGSFATFPLIVDEQVIGIIALQSATDFFTADMCDFIESLCKVAAISIAKAMLLKEEKQRVSELEKLREIDISIAKETDEQVVLEKIVKYCMVITGADDCFIRYKTANNTLKKVAGEGIAYSCSEDELNLDDPGHQSSLSVKAVKTRKGQFYDIRNDLYFNQLLIKIKGKSSCQELDDFKSWGSYPLFFGDQVIGILSINSKEENFFTEERKQLIEDFEHRAAIALGMAKLFREKGDIFFDIHHSLVAPLSSTKAAADMLSDGVVTNDRMKKKYYNIISSNVEYFANRVTEIMNLSKIEAGLFDFNKRKHPIKSIINDVIQLNRFSCERRKIKIEKTFERKNSSIYCDRDKIRDALQSILSNAVKFSENNTTITISLLSDKEWVSISIEDQGIGIPEYEISQLFDKHFRGELAKSLTINEEKIDGAGFGLTVAKKIIDKHNGEIKVESKVGEGSNFTIKLPVE